ncbi:hypothetical protein [Streptomyces sp. NPDC021096]|uniref:hypothetical protein n=1 Tax=Streptomyces sp. NPDC021096 TaxID=3154792 RepID=UPI00116126B9
MARHAGAAIDYYAAHDYGAVGGHAVDDRSVDDLSMSGWAAAEEPLPEVFEGLSVPVRTAASLLGLSPWTVAHLIERGELRSERGGQYRYVTLTSIFSYRRLTR